MAEQIKISNGKITAYISTRGAEIIRLTADGKEIIWEGDTKVWASHAPVLFPICGGLKNDRYTYEGKEYTLEKHGYARFKEFTAESVFADKAVFLLCSDEESRKSFPFDYELRIIYTLRDDKIEVEYNVKNMGNHNMYFSIGAHEGYACPEGIEDYVIEFEKTENLICNKVDGTNLSHEQYSVGENTNTLPLKNDYFTVDALVFLNLKSRSVFLKNKNNGQKIKVDFDGFDYLLIWTIPDAKYICIEPWCGLPDFTDSDGNIAHKTGIITLAAGETDVRRHSIEL